MDEGSAQICEDSSEERESALTDAPLSLERRITRLETLVWILLALNIPEALALTELI